MKKEVAKEIEIIRQNCEYTAEAHHIIASDSEAMARWFQLIPAIAASLSGLLVVGEVIPDWWGWITVIAAITTAIATVIDPLKGYYLHLNAAKGFVLIKNDARLLQNVTGSTLSDKELVEEVKKLSDRYKELVKVTPPTNDSAFERGSQRIKAGIHEPD